MALRLDRSPFGVYMSLLSTEMQIFSIQPSLGPPKLMEITHPSPSQGSSQSLFTALGLPSTLGLLRKTPGVLLFCFTCPREWAQPFCFRGFGLVPHAESGESSSAWRCHVRVRQARSPEPSSCIGKKKGICEVKLISSFSEPWNEQQSQGWGSSVPSTPE